MAYEEEQDQSQGQGDWGPIIPLKKGEPSPGPSGGVPHGPSTAGPVIEATIPGPPKTSYTPGPVVDTNQPRTKAPEERPREVVNIPKPKIEQAKNEPPYIPAGVLPPEPAKAEAPIQITNIEAQEAPRAGNRQAVSMPVALPAKEAAKPADKVTEEVRAVKTREEASSKKIPLPDVASAAPIVVPAPSIPAQAPSRQVPLIPAMPKFVPPSPQQPKKHWVRIRGKLVQVEE